MKMRPVGAESFLADRRTNVTKLRLFSQFCECT